MFVKTEERPHGEPQKVGALKLSEAIRIGARLRPQCFDEWYAELEVGAGSCALGAAAEGLLGHMESNGNDLICRFPELKRDEMESPVGRNRKHEDGTEGRFLIDHIVFLNDTMRWTRERIADWLEGQGY